MVTLFAGALFAGCAGSGGAERPDGPSTNITVISRLSAEVADSVITHWGPAAGAPVLLRVEPSGHWFVFDAFARALQSRGAKIIAGSGGTAALLDVNVVEAKTSYENARRSWFLGSTQVDRTVRVYLNLRTEAADSLRSVETGLACREVRDTVEAGQVPGLETHGIPSTQGTLPEGDWLDDFMEPLIVAGAVAVAVVLLFTVRS
jgi:hypothetical protein